MVSKPGDAAPSAAAVVVEVIKLWFVVESTTAVSESVFVLAQLATHTTVSKVKILS